ncbi:hypothetical protein AUJ84_01205 [Candidatus Pacearchaeota archaeon CG1_02_32_132]|nr:MAG: hypothetical protein AUJ84_01205 [Candidatus Pacearchaeota archaeon CG1_02_32_132]
MDSEYLVRHAMNFLRMLPIKEHHERLALVSFPSTLNYGDQGHFNYLTIIGDKNNLGNVPMHARKRQIHDELIEPIRNLAGTVCSHLELERIFSRFPLKSYNPTERESEKNKVVAFFCRRDGIFISPVQNESKPAPRRIT